MVTATIELPAAVYRRAAKAARARGVSFAAFARAEIERAAPPPRREEAAFPEGLPAAEFFAGIGRDAGRAAAAAWPADFPRPCGTWRDEARDPWA